MTQKYFKDSDYGKRWSKAVGNSGSLKQVLEDCVRSMPHSQGAYLLDVGVGNGRFIEPFLVRGTKLYVGVDLSRHLLNEIKGRLKNQPDYYKSVSLVRADAAHLPFRAQSFDKVICIGVFFFIPHMETFVTDISHILKKNGHFLTDFMDDTKTELTILSETTKIANHLIGITHRLYLTNTILKLFGWLNQVPLLHLYKGWFTSYLTYGMTPFYPRKQKNVIQEFNRNNLNINKTFTNKSTFILAQKT